MKSMKILMRVTKNRLEEIRKQMALYQQEKDQLYQFIEDLCVQLLKEKECAEGQMHLGNALAGYEKYVQERKYFYKEAIADVQKKIEALQEEITQNFQSLKRYELVLEKYIKKHNEKETKREKIALDAVALRKHSMHKQDKEQI